MKLRPMKDAPRGEEAEDILIFKDAATVTICHIARWEDGSDELFERGWWSYTRGSVMQEKIDDIGTIIGWTPLPDGIDEHYDEHGFLKIYSQGGAS